MSETKVIGARVGADVVKAVFSHVKTWRHNSNAVKVGAGALVGADDGYDTLYVASDLTINGSSVGVDGLDTGSLASSTWYHIWLIKQVGGETHGLLSLSATSPTMPAGYTIKRRVGTVRNDGSNDFLDYRQVGQWTTYQDAVRISSGIARVTPVLISLSAEAPPTVVSVRIQVRGPQNLSYLYLGYNSSGRHFVSAAAATHTDRQPGDGSVTLAVEGQYVYGYRDSPHTDGGTTWIDLSGYEDDLS